MICRHGVYCRECFLFPWTWMLYVIEYFSCCKGMDSDGEFHLKLVGQSVLMENKVDRGAEAFKADGLVFFVVLDIGELRIAVEIGVDGKSVSAPRGDLEHEYLCSIFTIGGKLYVTIELTGEGYGIVGAIGNDIVPVVS